VVVQGELRRQDRTVVLLGADAEGRVYLQFAGEPPFDGSVQVEGQALDLGRLSQDDPRLSTVDVEAILAVETQGRWPQSGEVIVIRVTQVSALSPSTNASVRALALEPERYVGQRVTVIGRFRGANLYGDLPQAPGKSRWDFVIQLADAAVWVTDLEPRGDGLDLDPGARVDTGKWVSVSGVVRRQDGLVWIDGQSIRAAEPAAEREDTQPETTVAPKGPPPEIAFSAPIQDDTDIETTTDVRIQFSRDMNPDSFADHVQVTYVGAPGEVPAPPAFTTRYRDEVRAITIAFGEPLERFQTVHVRLLEGIESFDGVPLAPWTLSFTVGAE
jgi:hypothetical protein